MKWRKILFNENLLFIKCYQMQNLQLFITKRITRWVIARTSQNMVFQTLVTSSCSSAAPNWSWELCRMQTGNSWFMTSTHQALETHLSLEVTLVTVHGEHFSKWYRRSLPKRVSQWMSNNSIGFFRYLHPACILWSASYKIKLPPNKRTLVKGCGCFMWFLFNEGDYFTAKPSTAGLAAQIPTFQIKAPTTGQSAKMKIRLVLQESLFLWPEVFFSQPQVFTEISQDKCSYLPLFTGDTATSFLTCAKQKTKSPLQTSSTQQIQKVASNQKHDNKSYITVQDFWA